MALPLKTGADLYNQQLIRARLQNLGAQPNTADVGLGQVYFNTGTNTAASLRIGYCYETGSVPKFHHVANLEDVNRLEELISALSGSSSESVASVLGRVITLEGYFSNGKAKDADLLDGHNSDYFATASGLSALQEKVSAFLDGEADSDAVLENLKEIQAFLDSYDGATSLADMFGAVNTQIADRYTKAEADARYLQLTGGIVANTSNAPLKIKTDSESAWVGIEYLNNLGEREGSIGVYGGKPIFVPAALDKIWTILHSGNYSDLITDLNKNLNVPSITIGGIKLSVVEGQLQIEGDAYATGQLSSGGIGSEGSGSGASGIVILEDWEKYDDTLAQVLGAGLGVGLRDKIAALESKATNVSVAQTLTSGKEIGAITIDGVATKLFAPSTYAWSEITSKPTTLDGYGITNAVRYNMYISLNGETQPLNEIGYGMTNYGWMSNGPAMSIGYSQDYWMQLQLDYFYGLHYRASVGNSLNWCRILDENNYATILGTVYAPYNAAGYLPLSGGSVTGNITIDGKLFVTAEIISKQHYLFARDNDGADWVVTTKGWAKEYALLHAGNYENIVGEKFLKLTGGTITTDNAWALAIKRNSDSASFICFTNTSGTLGYLGVATDFTPRYMDAGGNSHILLHANNFNSYAPTLTGTGASGTWGINVSGYSFGIVTSRNYNALGLTETKADQIVYCNTIFGSTEGLFPANVNYANAVLTINRHPDTLSGSQLGFSNNGNLYYRNAIDTTTAWKQVAFTDSNVASATKLATARSLWGNTFDGTADINTNLKFNANDTALSSWKKDGSSVSIFMQVNPDRHVLIGQGTARENGGLYLYGNDIRMCYGNAGSSNNTAMLINSSGNVTIGGSDLAGTTYKLYVDGDILLPNYKRLLSLDTSGNARNLVHLDSTNKVYFGDIGCESVLRGARLKIVTSANSSGVVINYTGNVTIGAEDKAGESQHFNVQNVFAVSSSFSKAAILNIVETDANTNYIHMFVGSNTTITNRPLVLQHGYGFVGIGVIEPQYKLDIDGSVRASNFGIIGSRLLVGGATDDGTSALQVNGSIRTPYATINSNAYNPYLKLSLESGEVSFIQLLNKGDIAIGSSYNHFIITNSGVAHAKVRMCVGGASDDGLTALAVAGHTRVTALTVSSALYINRDWMSGKMNDANNSGLSISTFAESVSFSVWNKAGSLVSSDLLRLDTSKTATINGDLKVTGNIIADGQVSSGGVAEAGTGGATGGSGLDRVVFTIPKDSTSFSCEHNLGTRDISVTIYEEGNDYQQVLADVYLDSTNVARVVFGSATDVPHKVVIIG